MHTEPATRVAVTLVGFVFSRHRCNSARPKGYIKNQSVLPRVSFAQMSVPTENKIQWHAG